MSDAQKTLLLGTAVAMMVEIAGIALLVTGEMAAGIGLVVVGLVIDLIAIGRWRSMGG